MNDALWKDCVQDIIKQANEVKAEPESEERTWKLLTYAEVLSSIQSYAIPIGPETIGLDFDIDERYLN